MRKERGVSWYPDEKSAQLNAQDKRGGKSKWCTLLCQEDQVDLLPQEPTDGVELS